MKNHTFIIFLVLFISFQPTSNSQAIIIGEHVDTVFNSPHPYSSSGIIGDTVWSDTISYTADTAKYIAVYFDSLELISGDSLIIRTLGGNERYGYSYDYNGSDYWSIPIHDDTIIIEIIGGTNSLTGSYGYKVSNISRGYSQHEIEMANSIISPCGGDDLEEIICYEQSEPEIYSKSNAIGRAHVFGSINQPEPPLIGWERYGC